MNNNNIEIVNPPDNKLSYNRICEEWHKFRKNSVINKCVADFAELLCANGDILDVGCGTGQPIAQYLANRGFHVTGIDFSAEMIKKAKALNLANATFIECDFFDFQSEKKFDGIIAFDSLWHIAKKNQPLIYDKLASLTKKGGFLLFTHGNRDDQTVGTMYNQEFYYSALPTDKVRELLIRAGFDVITLIENYKEKTTGDRDLLVIAQKR